MEYVSILLVVEKFAAVMLHGINHESRYSSRAGTSNRAAVVAALTLFSEL